MNTTPASDPWLESASTAPVFVPSPQPVGTLNRVRRVLQDLASDLREESSEIVNPDNLRNDEIISDADRRDARELTEFADALERLL